MVSRPLLLVAFGVSLSGCIYDPYAALDAVDLHVVVLRLDARATRIEVSARSESPTDGTAVVRALAPEPEGRAEVFVPKLPEGRFVVQARARGSEGETLACAMLDRALDAAAAPHDVTLDMEADQAPCVEVDVPSADAADDDPSPPARAGRPDAGPDDDLRRGPEDHVSGSRRDAKPADDDDEH